MLGCGVMSKRQRFDSTFQANQDALCQFYHTLTTTRNHVLSLILPSMKIDEHYTLNNIASPIFKSNPKITEIDGGDMIVRQKMRNSDEIHLAVSSVIIDNLIFCSMSVSLLLLLLFWSILQIQNNMKISGSVNLYFHNLAN